MGIGRVALGVGAGALVVGVVLDIRSGGMVRSMIADPPWSQGSLVLHNLGKPWLAPTAMGAQRDAVDAQWELWGAVGTLDGGQDAFRHAYAAALLTDRFVHDHGMAPDAARALVGKVGDAYERDHPDGGDGLSTAMDAFNNEVGSRLGLEHGSDAELRDRVLDALRSGELRVVDRDDDGASLVRTKTADGPPAQSGD